MRRARTRGGWIAVAWAPYSRRSEMFARELSGELHCIHHLRFQSPPHAPLKYLSQSVSTMSLLFRRRPAAVHVQNPPFVCALVVDAYCRVSGASFVIEYHSAAFSRAWSWALPLQRYVARRAAVNIVTSRHWEDIVRSWGGDAVVMYDPLLDLPDGRPVDLAEGFKVAFVGTFAPDEPLEAVLEAAALVPEVHFYVTGDTSKRSAPDVHGAPPNVTFTGFLDPNGEYLGLLRGVDAVMVLTTRDHTLQLAGCEAVAIGKPLITSDWPYLRELFGAGAVFVEPSAASIADGVREVVARHAELAADIPPFRAARQREWEARLTRLEEAAVAAGCNGVDMRALEVGRAKGRSGGT